MNADKEQAGNNFPEFSQSRTKLWQRLLTLPPRRPQDRSPTWNPAGNLRSGRRQSGKTGWAIHFVAPTSACRGVTFTGTGRAFGRKRKKPVPEGPAHADDGFTASHCGLSGTGSRKKPVPEGPAHADDGFTASHCGL